MFNSASAFGGLPLSFEANQGQTAAPARFLARGGGCALFLTPDAAVLRLEGPAGGDVVIMRLAGADPGAAAAGLEIQAGVSNYLTGVDPADWHTGVPHYGRVQFTGVYPGVDLVYLGDQGRLEYDFVVRPGGDPAAVRLSFAGTEGVTLDAGGNLVLHTAAGDLVEQAPVLYQDRPAGRQPVAGRFVLTGPNQVGFQVGAFDPRLPLVIDPVLAYSTFLGGSGLDSGQAIAVDGAGDTYIAGFSLSTDFPTTSGAFQTTAGDDSSAYAFVSELNPTGSTLLYSTYLGGTGDNRAAGIAVDSSGDAFVTGYTTANDFPITPGAFQATSPGVGRAHAFVTELNPTGTALVYSTYLGGNSYDYGAAIAVDGGGDAYVTGHTISANFPVTPGAFRPMPAGNGDTDAFVTELNSAGSALVYSSYFGGNNIDYGNGIAVDAAGDAYLTGLTLSTDLATPGAFQTANGGSYDAFVAEVNPTGTAVVYCTYLGGGDVDYAQAIAIDAAGDAFVTGTTGSVNFPTTPGAFEQTVEGHGNSHGFVAEVNPAGTGLVYSTYLGGNAYDIGEGIAVDAAGDAFVTGYTGSSDFPVTSGALQSTLAGNFNAFVTELTPDGTALNYSTYLGGGNVDFAHAIALDGSGNAYVTGVTYSIDFPTTAQAYQGMLAGSANAFVTELGPGGGAGSVPVTTPIPLPVTSGAGLGLGAEEQTPSRPAGAGAGYTLTPAWPNAFGVPSAWGMEHTPRPPGRESVPEDSPWDDPAWLNFG